MRRIFSLVTVSVLLSTLIIPLFSFAVDGTENLADFDIIAPTEVKVNEAFDVTVRAVDVSDAKITNYQGTINFLSTSNPDDIDLPFEDDEYQFQISDQGEKTFQKGFLIKKAGEYEVEVFEFDTANSISKTVKITAKDTGIVAPIGGDITIDDPATMTTIGTRSITVSGTTKPTSVVDIKLNGAKVGSAQSDVDGAFSFDIPNLRDGDNIITADLLSGSGTVAASSAPVTVKYSLDAPKISSLTITEGNEVFAGATINFVAVGDPGLKTVIVKVGDINAILEEDPSKLGTYTGIMKTSDFEGDFNADVAVESQLGVKSEIKKMATFRTITATLENVKVESTEKNSVIFSFTLDPDLDQIQYFKIKYGTATGNYTKESITYVKGDIRKDATYTWEVPNVEPGEYFSTVIALDANKKELPVTSGEQTFSILNAAPVCFVDKVSGLRVSSSNKNSSVITWDALKDASTYQVFKRDASGNFVMLDEVTTNQYTVNIDLTTEREIFEDFKIRALCKNGDYTGEGAYSESVSVQTGPEMILLFALFMASGVALILIKRGYLD